MVLGEIGVTVSTIRVNLSFDLIQCEIFKYLVVPFDHYRIRYTRPPVPKARAATVHHCCPNPKDARPSRVRMRKVQRLSGGE